MADQTEKNRKRKAVLVTVIFHIVAILLFLIFGLKQPNPLPEEMGASIEFGWDEAASGDFAADVQTPDPVVQQQVQEQTSEPEVVDETTVDEVATDETSEIAVPKEEEKPKPKPKPVKPTPKPKPVEEPKPTIDDKLKGALESLSKPSGGGGSQGDKEGKGDQGDPKGTTGSGALGGGSGSWSLDGRSMMGGYGTKIVDTKEEGIVVMNIWVDRNGKVTKVQPNLLESNTTSQYLINMAKNDVLSNFKFNGDPNASIEQRGKVRYDFRLK